MIDREKIDECEICNKPIFDGDKYFTCADGPYLCEDHAPRLSDVIAQHEELLNKVPFDCGELGYFGRDEMKIGLMMRRSEMAEYGDRNILDEA